MAGSDIEPGTLALESDALLTALGGQAQLDISKKVKLTVRT